MYDFPHVSSVYVLLRGFRMFASIDIDKNDLCGSLKHGDVVYVMCNEASNTPYNDLMCTRVISCHGVGWIFDVRPIDVCALE
jgi:hypothetical protein